MTVEEKRSWKIKLDKKLSDIGFSCTTCEHNGHCGFINQSFVKSVKYCGYWQPETAGKIHMESDGESDPDSESEKKARHFDEIVNQARCMR